MQSSFVRMTAREFCDLARAKNPKPDSKDDVEVSMARTLSLYEGKDSLEILFVNPKVAARLQSQPALLDKTSNKTDNKTEDK